METFPGTGNLAGPPNLSSERTTLERTVLRRNAGQIANLMIAGREVRWDYFSQPLLADYWVPG